MSQDAPEEGAASIVLDTEKKEEDATPPTGKYLCRMEAVWPWVPQQLAAVSSKEFAFEAGDSILATQKDASGWWSGRLLPASEFPPSSFPLDIRAFEEAEAQEDREVVQGVFPANYCKEVEVYIATTDGKSSVPKSADST